MLKAIDWESWAAFLTFVTILGGAVWFLIKRFIPTREEYESLKGTVVSSIGKMAEKTNRNETDVRSLFRERSSFRKEVLDRIEHVEERINSLADDISELKNLLIEKR